MFSHSLVYKEDYITEADLFAEAKLHGTNPVTPDVLFLHTLPAVPTAPTAAVGAQSTLVGDNQLDADASAIRGVMQANELTQHFVVRKPQPIRINNTDVNWIDAKCFYGNSFSHDNVTSLQRQTQRYTDKFGPGAIVFRHGFCDELSRQIPGALFLDGSNFDTTALDQHVGDVLRDTEEQEKEASLIAEIFKPRRAK